MRRSLSLAMVLVCAALAMAPPAPAQAHTGLEEASPSPGQEIAPGVSVLALTFAELRADGPREVTVTGPDEAAVPIGELVLVNAATLCAAVEPLPAGFYAVSYRVTSRDEHPISGRYLFEVTEDGPVLGYPQPCQGIELPAAASGPPTGSGSDAGPATGVIAAAGGLVGLLAALAIGGLVLRARRRTRNAHTGHGLDSHRAIKQGDHR